MDFALGNFLDFEPKTKLYGCPDQRENFKRRYIWNTSGNLPLQHSTKCYILSPRWPIQWSTSEKGFTKSFKLRCKISQNTYLSLSNSTQTESGLYHLMDMFFSFSQVGNWNLKKSHKNEHHWNKNCTSGL